KLSKNTSDVAENFDLLRNRRGSNPETKAQHHNPIRKPSQHKSINPDTTQKIDNDDHLKVNGDTAFPSTVLANKHDEKSNQKLFTSTSPISSPTFVLLPSTTAPAVPKEFTVIFLGES